DRIFFPRDAQGTMTKTLSADKDAAATARFPGWIPRTMIALGLVIGVLARLIGLLDDPPFPFDDPAIRNLTTLISWFLAGLTAWFWFCFRSGYPRRLRLGIAMGTALVAVAIVGITAALGLKHLIQFSGSLVPRLATREHDAALFSSSSNSGSANLSA